MEAAGVEPEISVENTQLTDSENASIAENATISKSSVQITYKDFPELQNFQASPALAQHAEVLFNIYTSIGCRGHSPHYDHLKRLLWNCSASGRRSGIVKHDGRLDVFHSGNPSAILNDCQRRGALC